MSYHFYCNLLTICYFFYSIDVFIVHHKFHIKLIQKLLKIINRSLLIKQGDIFMYMIQSLYQYFIQVITTCRELMLISKTKKVFIITFNAPNKEREKLIFCVRFLMRYCENAETEASFIIYRKVSNNNYFLFLILRSITIYLNIIQCVLFIDIGSNVAEVLTIIVGISVQ